MSFEDVKWIELAQDIYQWWSFVNMVISFGFYKTGKFIDQLMNCQLLKGNLVSWCQCVT
jgi:hypothetical protein